MCLADLRFHAPIRPKPRVGVTPVRSDHLPRRVDTRVDRVEATRWNLADLVAPPLRDPLAPCLLNAAAMLRTLLLIGLATAGCIQPKHAPGGDDSAPDGSTGSGSAVTPDLGPHSHGVSAAGRETKSAHFTLVSVTGQPTPVGNGRSNSAHFIHVPGILGGQ